MVATFGASSQHVPWSRPNQLLLTGSCALLSASSDGPLFERSLNIVHDDAVGTITRSCASTVSR
jgi:hypothetical protein